MLFPVLLFLDRIPAIRLVTFFTVGHLFRPSGDQSFFTIGLCRILPLGRTPTLAFNSLRLSVLFPVLLLLDRISAIRHLGRHLPDLVQNLERVLVPGCCRCCLDRRRLLQPHLQRLQASVLSVIHSLPTPSWAED